MILLFDIGNTNTHLGLANSRRVIKQADIPTTAWLDNSALAQVAELTGRTWLKGAALCSVVPHVTPEVCQIRQAYLASELSGADPGYGARCRH